MKEHKRFYAFARLVIRAILPLLLRLRGEGIQRIPVTGPVILTPNHIAWMDIPAMSLLVPRPVHHMAKSELFNIPLLGGLIRLLGAFPVRRGEGDRESLRMAGEVLAAGQVLVVFPEGHRSGTGRLGPGLPGVALIALRNNVPIVPVAITGTERTLKGFRYGPWAPKVHIIYGEPFTLETSGSRRSREDLERGIDTIMGRIAALLPPEYRGVYAQQAASPVAAGPTPEHPDAGSADPLAAERQPDNQESASGASEP